MKTRAEDLEEAMKEALQMLERGRPADAAETLSAALDAPTTSQRGTHDVELERVLREFGDMVPEDVARAARRAASSARDAALEEAIDTGRIARPPEGFTLSGRDKVVFNMGVRAAVDRIHALQSAPAQVVSKAEVREVVQRLMAHFNEQTPIQSGYRGALRQVAVDLGVDLDAAPAKDTRQTCTCLGVCRGEDRLALGWRCALGKEPKR